MVGADPGRARVPTRLQQAVHIGNYIKGDLTVKHPSTARSLRRRSRRIAASLSVFGLVGATFGASQVAAASSRTSKGQDVTITFLNVGASPQVLAYFNQTVIPDFEKIHPNITVDMSTVPWGESFTKLQTSVVAGTADDVFVMGNIMLPTLASKHGLYPLTKFVKNWSVARDLNQPALKAGIWDGVQYAVPFNLDVRGVIYNKSMFKKAGITSPPTTWNEYRVDAAKLVQKSGGQIKVEGADWAIDNSVGLAQTFNLLLTEAGGQMFKQGPNGSATFTGNSAAGKKALNYLVSFYKGGLSSTNFIDVGVAPPPISLGEAAMEINNASALADASPSIASQLQMTLPLKATSTSKPVGMEFVNKLGIYARTKHPNSAWDFVSYLYTPTVLSKWDQLLGEAPTETSLANTPAWSSGPFHAELVNAKYAQVFPVELQSTVIDEDLTSIVDAAIYQKESVPAALAQMTSQITPLLKG